MILKTNQQFEVGPEKIDQSHEKESWSYYPNNLLCPSSDIDQSAQQYIPFLFSFPQPYNGFEFE